MSDECDPIHELQALAEQLGTDDWRMVLEAETDLVRAGQAGIDAVLWGLSHPARECGGDAQALWTITAPMRVLLRSSGRRCMTRPPLSAAWLCILRAANGASRVR